MCVSYQHAALNQLWIENYCRDRFDNDIVRTVTENHRYH